MVLDAVYKGAKAFICEKPMAVDVGEMREMMAICREKQVLLVISHQRRQAAHFQKLKALIDEGVLGDQLEIKAHVGNDWGILKTYWYGCQDTVKIPGPFP